MIQAGDIIPLVARQSSHRSTSLKLGLLQHEYDHYFALLDKVAEVFRRYNISFTMSDGTLLGSFVFHDVIPWDDDMDIKVSYRDYSKLKRVVYQDPEVRKILGVASWGDGAPPAQDEYNEDHINTIYPDVDPYRHKPILHKHKLFFANEAPTFNYPWRWPFVDIAFFKQNETHVWNHDNHKYYHKIQDYLPFHPRPLGTRWYPAIANTRLAMEKHYEQFKCESHAWDHKKERGRIPKRVSCTSLAQSFSHVRRRVEDGKILEEKHLDGRPVYAAIIDEKNPRVVKPLTIK